MNSVYLESAKKIKNPSQSEVEAERPTLFDTWVYRHPDSSHSGRPNYRLLAIAKSYLFQLVKEIIFCDGIFILLNGTYRVNILGEAEVAKQLFIMHILGGPSIDIRYNYEEVFLLLKSD